MFCLAPTQPHFISTPPIAFCHPSAHQDYLRPSASIGTVKVLYQADFFFVRLVRGVREAFRSQYMSPNHHQTKHKLCPAEPPLDPPNGDRRKLRKTAYKTRSGLPEAAWWSSLGAAGQMSNLQCQTQVRWNHTVMAFCKPRDSAWRGINL